MLTYDIHIGLHGPLHRCTDQPHPHAQIKLYEIQYITLQIYILCAWMKASQCH